MYKEENETRGGKEIGLLELKQHANNFGYFVPDFIVAGTEDDLKAIANHFSGNAVIVRSNSIMENSEFGFDGIYESVVVAECTPKKLGKAYSQVMKSLDSHKAQSYRKKVGVQEDSMRVIVQQLVHEEPEKFDGIIYFVAETSINAQGDCSIVMGNEHDFINSDKSYEEAFVDKNGRVTTSTQMSWFALTEQIKKLATIGRKLQDLLGPLSLEGAFARKSEDHEFQIFLFQRRTLERGLYDAQPEQVPSHYIEEAIIFRSSSYRGSGKLEQLPVIVMPDIDGSLESWEQELKRRASQIDSDFFLFVKTMHLGKISSRILEDYSCLSGAKAIITYEGIDYMSHAFKVAMLSRLPFVSLKESFEAVKTLDTGSLFFTENQAVFCLDKKNSFGLVKKFEETSASNLPKDAFSFSVERDLQELTFEINLKKISFKRFEEAFCRALETVTDEAWFLQCESNMNLGFQCRNSAGHIIAFSGSANYFEEVGYLKLLNFSKYFDGENQIEWTLLERVAIQLTT